MKKKEKKEKIEYKVYSFRLNDWTVENMKSKKGGLSWNLYFCKLLKDHENGKNKV